MPQIFSRKKNHQRYTMMHIPIKKPTMRDHERSVFHLENVVDFSVDKIKTIGHKPPLSSDFRPNV